MDEAAHWHRLADEFRRLVERDIGSVMYAGWFPPEWNEPWRLFQCDEYAAHQFRTLAERAAVLLGQPADDKNAFTYWLNVLKQESPYHHAHHHSRRNTTGEIQSGEGGVIEAVFSASMDQCYKFETRAIARERTADSVSAIAERPARETQPSESIAEQLSRLRAECRWTEEQLAEKIGVAARTVQRHLSDKSTPYARHISAYERAFSKHLVRKVVINKMS